MKGIDDISRVMRPPGHTPGKKARLMKDTQEIIRTQTFKVIL